MVSVLSWVYSPSEAYSRTSPDRVNEVSQQESLPTDLSDNNMEIVLSNDVICAGEEVTVQMFTRVLNASSGIQFRNIEIFNSDIDPSVNIRETYFVEESDLNGNGYLDWLDLDGEDYVAPNGDLRSDEEFLHEYSRVFTETTTIDAGDKADVFLLDDDLSPDSASDLDVAISAQDSATLTVFNPSVSIIIEPVTEEIFVGEPAEFNVKIVNEGDIDLTYVSVSHEEASGCDGALPVIAVGEEFEYTCQIASATRRTTFNVEANSFAGDKLCTVETTERAVISATQPTAVPTNTPEPTTTATPEPANTAIATATTTPKPTNTPLPATPLPSPMPVELTIMGCDQPLTSSRATLNGVGTPNTQAQIYVNSIDFATFQIGAAGEWAYGVEFSSPGQYDIYVQSFNQSGGVADVSVPIRCVVPEPEKPHQLPETGSALMKNSATVWTTLLLGMLIGLVACYERRKREV